MTEKKFFPDQSGTAQEQEIENRIYDFLLDNQGSAFNLKALMNRLEEIVVKPEDIDLMKENLQQILDKMINKGLINLVYHDGEDHYLVKEEKPETPERGGLNLEPIKDWIKDNQLRALGWLVLFGLLVGILSAVVFQARQLLVAVGILVITISLIGELIVNRNLSKNNQKYSIPVYGIIAIGFDIIGLIIIRPIGLYTYSYGAMEMVYAIPLAIVALICGAASFYRYDVNHATISLGSTFLGAIILMVGVLPPLIYVLGFAVFFLVGGW
ncbi:MAG: hypothetical protein ACXAEX_01720 [Promethearchaeota archaeon]|jgi:hypothetical protein